MTRRITITSRSNPRITHLRKVREGKVDSEIFLEGVRVAEEAVRSGVKILDCVVTVTASDNERIKQLLGAIDGLGTRPAEVPDQLLKSLADTVSSQGIVLSAERPGSGLEMMGSSLEDGLAGCVVCLMKVADPANLGTIFRTAEAAGAAGIITSTGSADAFSPKVNRAALGANLRLPVWEGAESEAIFTWAKERGLTVRGADIAGKMTHTSLDWTKPSLIVFGSEAHGLEPEVLSRMDETFRIQLKNHVESLNLSVSTGVVLFEALRQCG